MKVFGTELFNASGEFAAVVAHNDAVYAVIAGYDSSRVVAFDLDGKLVWQREHEGEFPHFAKTSDGYVLGSWEGCARFTDEGEQVAEWEPDGNFFTYSPDGSALAVYGNGGRVEVWDTATGKMTFENQEEDGEVFSAAFSHDGRYFASGSQKGALRLFDRASGEELGSKNSTKLIALAFSRDDAWLTAGHGHGKVLRWAVPDLEKDKFQGAHEFETGGGGPSGCRWIDYLPDGSRIWSLGNEHLVRIWDESGTEVGRLEVPRQHAQGPSCSLSPNGRVFAVGSTAAGLSVWVDGTRVTAEMTGSPRRLALSGDYVALAGTKRVRTWSREGPELNSFPISFPPSDVVSVPNGFVRVSYDQVDPFHPNDDAAGHGFKAGRYTSGPVAVSPDGTLIAIPVGNEVEIWNLESNLQFTTLPHDKPTSAVAFGPDGAWLVTADNQLHLWQLAEKPVELATYELDESFFGKVYDLAISPLGHVVASWDGMGNNFTPSSYLDVVDPTDMTRLHRLNVEGARLGHLAFAGPTRVVTACSAGLLHIADVETGEWLEPVVDEESFRPSSLSVRPVAAFGDSVAYVSGDLNVRLVELEPATASDAPSRGPVLQEIVATDPSLMFEERLAGTRFLFTGRFEDTSKSFREDTAAELGATVTKTANAKVTHMVVGKPKYGQHKPSSAEKKILELIEDGASITVLSELEMADLFFPTTREGVHMLREDKRRWNAWRKRFGHGNFRVKFQGADLSQCDLTGANIEGISFGGANLEGTTMTGVGLSGTTFVGANLQNAKLDGANCWRTDFSSANLRDATFSGAELTWSNVVGADLQGADFSGAKLLKTDMSQAVWDETTTWPDGFDPDAEI